MNKDSLPLAPVVGLPSHEPLSRSIPEPPASGTAEVPTKPNAVMLAAGARAGDVSVEIAWKVYQAMVRAAQ